MRNQRLPVLFALGTHALLALSEPGFWWSSLFQNPLPDVVEGRTVGPYLLDSVSIHFLHQSRHKTEPRPVPHQNIHKDQGCVNLIAFPKDWRTQKFPCETCRVFFNQLTGPSCGSSSLLIAPISRFFSLYYTEEVDPPRLPSSDLHSPNLQSCSIQEKTPRLFVQPHFRK